MQYGSLARLLKEKGLLQPPLDAPKVGEVRYWNGDPFKILEVDWMNDSLLVQCEDDPPQYCGYHTFCEVMSRTQESNPND